MPREKFVPRHARRGSCAVWFILGAMAGSFAVGLYWLRQEADATQAEQTAAATTQQLPPQPRFDFYNLLPEMEVVVTDAEVEAAASAPQPKVAAEPPGKQAKTGPGVKPVPTAPETAPVPTVPETPPAQETYLLQIGSFRRPEDAERLKAQLALQGVQAQIQQVTINGKDTFHRVRTGTLRGTQQLNDIRGRLRKNGMDSIVIKLKG